MTKAYSLASLYFILLKVSGVDTSKHPIKSELARIKRYFVKLKAIKSKIKAEEVSSTIVPKKEENETTDLEIKRSPKRKKMVKKQKSKKKKKHKKK